MTEGKKLPVSIVVSAVDNVTYKVMAINEKIKRITAPVAKVRQAFGMLGDELGLGKLAKNLGKVSSTGKALFNEMGEAAFKIGALAAGAAASVFAVVKGFSHAGDEVSTVAQRLGLTTNAYQELAYAAELADVDQETFNGSMQKFSKGIAEAAAGTGEALVGFNALGISVRDSHGKLRSLESMLPEVADKLGQIKNQNLRNALAAKMFGREGMKLNGMFVEGAEGLARLRKQAYDVGAVMSPEEIKNAEQFDDGLKRITHTLTMVRNIVGNALAPVLLGMMEKLGAYLMANKARIEAWAQAFAKNLPGYIDQASKVLTTLWGVVEKLAGAVGWLSDRFGAANVMLGAFAIYFGGGIIGSIVSFAGALMSLGGSVVPLLIRGLALLWPAMGLVAAGIKGITLAIISNPIGALVAGLVGAAILIYKYWEPIKTLFSNLWDKVSGFFGAGKTASVALSTTQQGSQLGPSLGASKTVDAAARSSTQRNESVVSVSFDNLPKGARVQTEKTDVPLDLTLGYTMVGL